MNDDERDIEKLIIHTTQRVVAMYSVAYGKVVCRLGDRTRENDWELVEVKKIVHQPPQMTFKDRKHKIILNFSRSWRGRGGLLLD